jgi:hypothetical protein
LYAIASGRVARRIVDRFQPDGATAAAIAIGLTTIFMSASGLMLFALWSSGIEMLRIGNAHMSYRVGRAPWSHHTLAVFVVAAAIFLLAAARRYRSVCDAARGRG